MTINKIDPRIKGTIAAFGFSNDQIEVYCAGLELGTAMAEELSERAGLDLDKTKDILETLIIEHKLVDEIIDGEMVKYQMAPFEDVFVDRQGQ